jgi:hypothetical protein
MKVEVSNSQMALLHSRTFIGINFQASGPAELVFRNIHPVQHFNPRIWWGSCEHYGRDVQEKVTVRINGAVTLITREAADEFWPLNASSSSQ